MSFQIENVSITEAVNTAKLELQLTTALIEGISGDFVLNASSPRVNRFADLVGDVHVYLEYEYEGMVFDIVNDSQDSAVRVFSNPLNPEIALVQSTGRCSFVFINGEWIVQQFLTNASLSGTAFSMDGITNNLLANDSQVLRYDASPSVASILRMPLASALNVGTRYLVNNNAAATLTINDYTDTTLTTVASGVKNLVLQENTTAAGVWIIY
jgi:hypothetical protein